MVIERSSTDTTPLLRPLIVASTHPSSINNSSRETPSDTNLIGSHVNPTPSVRIAAAMYSFIVLGLFASTVGVMLPPISRHYALNDLQVSYIFLMNPIGYILSAQTNALIHARYGQRGIAILGPLLHFAAAIMIASHPPYWVVLLGYAVLSAGYGLVDGSWCSMAAGMENANFVSGLLHGSFSTGAALGPFLAGTLLAKGNLEWWMWYYVLAVTAILELIVLLIAFRDAAGSSILVGSDNPSPPSGTHSSTLPRLRAISAHPVTWISAAYFLTDCGVEVAISGWIVSFMNRARHASPYLASLSSSGFWAGMAVGRLLLGSLTDRVGVRFATTIYLLCSIGLQALFVSLNAPIMSIVLMTLLGAVMGPLFPSGVVVLTQLLPEELHVTAVSFVASVGQIGGAALPFAIGALVEGVGIGVFGYVVLVFSIVVLGWWGLLSRLRTKQDIGYGSIDSSDDYEPT